MKNLIFICLVFFAVTTKNYAASFDCKKASTLVENAICADSELSELDDSLASAYRDALANANNAAKIKTSELTWLKKRDRCKDKTCIKKLYTQRLNALIDLSAAQTYAQSNNALPQKVGGCSESSIVEKNTRFEGAVPGDAGGEAVVALKNDLYLYVQSVTHLPDSINVDKYMYSTSDFAKGNKVSVCLIELPKNCPADDDRGRVYSVTNHKNKKVFIGVDSWHLCGGA